jgi:hypothetical protein
MKLCFFLLIFKTIYIPYHSSQDNLWNRMKNHNIKIDELTENEKIFYQLYCIKDNVNVLNCLQDILAQNIPLISFHLRKFLEERIVMLKDTNLKNGLLELLLDNYIYYKTEYQAISRHFKLQIILNYLRKKYVFFYAQYKCAYEYLQCLSYSFVYLPQKIVKQLSMLYKIDLDQRFIFLIYQNQLQLAFETIYLSSNDEYKKIIKRIIFLEQKQIKPKVFLNIFELYWYIISSQKNLTIVMMADIILQNKWMLISIPAKYNQFKTNIINIIGTLLPSLIIQDYPKINELLSEELVQHKEPCAHNFYYIKGLYKFFKKDYPQALNYFYKALGKHSTIKDRGKYSFWIANTLSILDRKDEALKLYHKVFHLNVHYYSHMSSLILQKSLYKKSIQNLYIDKNKNIYDWYLTALEIVATGDDFMFFLSLLSSFHMNLLIHITPTLKKMLENLSNLNNKTYITLLTEKIHKKTGLILEEGYPLLHYMHSYPKNISLFSSAICRQESFFRTSSQLKSDKGALGIMQVMPVTAKTICYRNKIEFSVHQLQNNHHYNINISIKCINELISIFQNSLFCVIPAYNIGSVQVLLWKKFFIQHLDFKKIEHMLLWVEFIPHTITRNYTKDVLSSYIIFLCIHDITNLNPLQLLLFKNI